MKSLLAVFTTVAQFGGLGLFLVGVFDSSFLFMPLGNDLLMLVLTARAPRKLAWFALMAALGSTVGALIIDVIARKGGEQGLARLLPAKRLDYVKNKVQRHAGWALAAAALLPPPFPFTPFVAAAAAVQYPRWRLIAVLLSARMLRFSAVGALGIAFGRGILALTKAPAFQYGVFALLALFVVGSILSVYGWVQRSKRREGVPAST